MSKKERTNSIQSVISGYAKWRTEIESFLWRWRVVNCAKGRKIMSKKERKKERKNEFNTISNLGVAAVTSKYDWLNISISE